MLDFMPGTEYQGRDSGPWIETAQARPPGGVDGGGEVSTLVCGDAWQASCGEGEIVFIAGR